MFGFGSSLLRLVPLRLMVDSDLGLLAPLLMPSSQDLLRRGLKLAERVRGRHLLERAVVLPLALSEVHSALLVALAIDVSIFVDRRIFRRERSDEDGQSMAPQPQGKIDALPLPVVARDVPR